MLDNLYRAWVRWLNRRHKRNKRRYKNVRPSDD